MYILNDYTQNYPFCILQLVVETFFILNLMNYLIKTYYKDPKVAELKNKKLWGLI